MEMEINDKRLNLEQALKKLANKFNETESGCRECEALEEETPEEFLKKLVAVVEMMNFKYCPNMTTTPSPKSTL